MTVFLDAGHGGLKDGRYVTAPAKQYRHPDGEYMGDGWFWEGVYNRIQAKATTASMRGLGIEVIPVYNEITDNSLKSRVATANRLKNDSCIFLSLHANASQKPQTGNGIETFAVPGAVHGGKLSSLLMEAFAQAPTLRQRFRFRGAKRASFYVLRNVKMPACLIEHGFFDHSKDATNLLDPEVQAAFAQATAKAVQDFFTNHYK